MRGLKIGSRSDAGGGSAIAESAGRRRRLRVSRPARIMPPHGPIRFSRRPQSQRTRRPHRAGARRPSLVPAATRVDIGYTHEGASGICRNVRRASNGDLYVTGPSLKRTMFRSSDGGRSWSAAPYDLGMERFELRQTERDSEYGWIGAFTILRDDAFLHGDDAGERLRPGVHRLHEPIEAGPASCIRAAEAGCGVSIRSISRYTGIPAGLGHRPLPRTDHSRISRTSSCGVTIRH